MKAIRSRRVPYQKNLSYGHNWPIFAAHTTNISESGVHLESAELFEPGEKVTMTIYAGKEEYRCTGRVAWVKRSGPGARISSEKEEMGISFKEVSPLLLKHIQDLLAAGFDCLDTNG